MAQINPIKFLRRKLYSCLRLELSPRLECAALVFAPHQDDEVLGCGGTIILKRQAGTRVTVAFMTDGSTSHRQFMDASELCRLRKREALDAAVVLGMNQDDICFLDFPDGELRGSYHAAVEKVGALLNQHVPTEIFVPYQHDMTSDHEATFRIVMEAVRLTGRPASIYEYPVWVWHQWPWVPLRLTASRDGLRKILQMLKTCFGWKFLREFRCGVFVADVMERKRRALDQHRSQMTVLRPGAAWPTLKEVSSGKWLECFWQDYEVFRCQDFLQTKSSEPDLAEHRSAAIQARPARETLT